MNRPTSFRLPQELLDRLDQEASSQETSVTTLVTTLLDEGLKTRRFPGVVYRDGPTGRRAGLAGGPDVWEIIRALKQSSNGVEQRIGRLSEQLGLSEQRIRMAVEFYVTFPDEIDQRIAQDERAAAAVRERMRQRQRLIQA